jgi:ATP-binding cassette subfamily C protein LapB
MSTPSDTLLECLRFVAQHHQLPATAESLSAGLPLGERGLTPDLLARAADRAGLNTRLRKLTLGDIPDTVCPAILLLDGGEACVFLGRDEAGRARVLRPGLIDAESSEDLQALQAECTGHVLLARPRFRMDRRVTGPSPGREGHWFWSAMKANLPVYRDVLLAAFFIGLFALALPLFTMNVYDRVVPNAAFETLWMLAAGMLVILLGDVLLRTLRAYFVDLASRRVDVELSAKIMEQALGMRLEQRRPPWAPSPSTCAPSKLSATSLPRPPSPASSICPLPCCSSPLSRGSPGRFSSPCCWESSCWWALPWSCAPPAASHREHLPGRSHAQCHAHRSPVRGGNAESHGCGEVMQRRWEESTRYLAGVGVRLRLTSASVTHATLWCQQAVSVMVIITGVYLIAAGELTMGGLIASTMLASRSVAPFGQLAGLISTYHNARIALTSLDELFATPTEHGRRGPTYPGSTLPARSSSRTCPSPTPVPKRLPCATSTCRSRPGNTWRSSVVSARASPRSASSPWVCISPAPVPY